MFGSTQQHNAFDLFMHTNTETVRLVISLYRGSKQTLDQTSRERVKL